MNINNENIVCVILVDLTKWKFNTISFNLRSLYEFEDLLKMIESIIIPQYGIIEIMINIKLILVNSYIFLCNKNLFIINTIFNDSVIVEIIKSI